MATREEKDALGSISVSQDKMWGAQTQRALHNFSIGAVYGKCLAALGIVESFSLFAFVFALLLI